MAIEYIDPYGIRPPPSPVKDHVITVWQGDTMYLYRKFSNPDGTPVTPASCHLEFTVKSQRFATDILFQATWDKDIVPVPGVLDGTVRISMGSENTAHLYRGTLLYSIVWKDRLNNETVTLEEGNMLVEYSAEAPNPEIPYNQPLDDEEVDQTAGGF